MKRPVQYFKKSDLERASKMTPTQIAQFLEDFRQLSFKSGGSKLISLRVPEYLLENFKLKASAQGVKYQAKIKELMSNFVQTP